MNKNNGFTLVELMIVIGVAASALRWLCLRSRI